MLRLGLTFSLFLVLQFVSSTIRLRAVSPVRRFRLFSICNLLIPLHFRMMIILLLRSMPATFSPHTCSSFTPAASGSESETRWEAERKSNSIICCRMRFEATCHPTASLSRSARTTCRCYTITCCDRRLICFTFPKDKLQTHTNTRTHMRRELGFDWQQQEQDLAVSRSGYPRKLCKAD